MTYAEGRDALYGLVKAAWVAAYPSAPMLYADRDAAPPASGLWARSMVKFNDAGAAALGRRLWDRRGILAVQLFQEAGQGSVLDTAGQTMVNALEGVNSPAFLTQVKMVDVGLDGKWNQVQVTAEFEFQQLK